jgi:hypothetical protein
MMSRFSWNTHLFIVHHHMFLMPQRVDLVEWAYIAVYGKCALIRIRDQPPLSETLAGLDKILYGEKFHVYGTYVEQTLILHSLHIFAHTLPHPQSSPVDASKVSLS